MNMYRYGFSLLVLLICTGVSQASGGFGVDRLLYCTFEPRRIVISLDQRVGGLCTRSLETLNERIDILSESIERSSLYARYSRDKRYRREVTDQLKADMKPLVLLRDQLIQSMDTFEAGLFKQFQRLLHKQLSSKIAQIERSFAVVDKELMHGKLSMQQEEQYMQELIRLSSIRALLAMLKEQTTFEGVYDVREQLKQQ